MSYHTHRIHSASGTLGAPGYYILKFVKHVLPQGFCTSQIILYKNSSAPAPVSHSPNPVLFFSMALNYFVIYRLPTTTSTKMYIP